MSIAIRAKILHGVATCLILLFALQLGLAVVSEFAPPRFQYGHALYPIFLGRTPFSIANVLINFALLFVALVAFFYADMLQGQNFFAKNIVARRRPPRDGSVHFSQ